MVPPLSYLILSYFYLKLKSNLLITSLYLFYYLGHYLCFVFSLALIVFLPIFNCGLGSLVLIDMSSFSKPVN